MQTEKLTLTQRVLAIADLYHDGDVDKALAYMIAIGCRVLEMEAEEAFKSRSCEFDFKK